MLQQLCNEQLLPKIFSAMLSSQQLRPNSRREQRKYTIRANNFGIKNFGGKILDGKNFCEILTISVIKFGGIRKNSVAKGNVLLTPWKKFPYKIASEVVCHIHGKLLLHCGFYRPQTRARFLEQ